MRQGFTEHVGRKGEALDLRQVGRELLQCQAQEDRRLELAVGGNTRALGIALGLADESYGVRLRRRFDS